MSAITVGLNSFHYAILTDDTEAAVTYDVPKKLARAISATINPNSSNADLYADDGLAETDSSLAAIEVEIGVDQIPKADEAALLGHTITAQGGIVKKETDKAPYVAIGFRSPNSDGSEKLVWLFKGKFQVRQQSYQTKGETIEYQTPTISARFLRRDFDKAWEYSVNTGDEGVDEALITNWFTTVPDPAAPVTPIV